VVPPSQEQLDTATSTLYRNLDRLEKPDYSTESIPPQAFKVEQVTSNSETQIPDSDYSSSLIDHYATSSTTPPLIPFPDPFSFAQHDTPTQQLDEELRLLRSRLAESKARIDALAEEKLHMMQSHRREVFMLSDRVNKLDQEVIGSRMQIKDLVSENERLKEERDDVVQQLKCQIEENENVEKYNKELQKEMISFREYKLKMRDSEIEYQRLFKEKDSWQGQIDSMHQRLSDAERRVRCLGIITRQKYEAKQDGAYGSGSAVGRSTKLHFSPHVKGPSMDVITSVTIFNEEVLQTASYIAEHLEKIQSNTGLLVQKELNRAREIWGSKVVLMLQQQAQSSSRLNDLLLKNCLEVFMTHWCVNIAEGWYPKQPSFSDILVELSAQSTSVVYNGLGKFRLNPPTLLHF
jgi:hypothetical protein